MRKQNLGSLLNKVFFYKNNQLIYLSWQMAVLKVFIIVGKLIELEQQKLEINICPT